VEGRLNREQFYDSMSSLEEADLRKALWTLYWRGSATVRDRVMAAVDPSSPAARTTRPAPVDASELVREVTEFAALARHGAYLAGDRRVSPKERTRWRFTFRRLEKAAIQALAGRDIEPAASAMATLIDLACEMGSKDYFRSDDAVEAARFVVSDAAATMWSAIRREQGHAAFCERAAGQLLRWESRWGWTRRGEGRVCAQETTLAEVVTGMLPTPDAWGSFADHYLLALDEVAARPGRRSGVNRERTERLREWHALLRERLAYGEYADRIDVLAHHPALVTST
jgi:hypothetical protein